MTLRIAGIELGGTKSIAVLAVGDDIVARRTLATTVPAVTLAALTAQVAAWHAAAPLAAIGIGSFGPLALDPADASFGCITTTPKPGWAAADVRGAFTGFGLPIGFDTDVAGAALAEGRWGAAHGCRDHVYLTIGTGVGAGIVAGGRLVHGAGHPEVGHLRIRRVAGDTFPGACPFHGDCLEGLVAGPALAARTGIAGAAIPDDHRVWANVGMELAEACASLILTLGPRRIVVGGGVGLARAALLPAVAAATRGLLADYLPAYGDGLEQVIVPAALGHGAGPRGAVLLGIAALAGE